AVFGEVTWHINDDWSLTVGGRYFERSNTNYYLVNHPGAFPDATGVPLGEPDMAVASIRAERLANGGLPPGRSGDEDQVIPKISLSYAVGDNAMVYGLYTQGLRQGGVNRSRGVPFFPNTYTSDIMDNYEIGYKSTFAEGRGRLNATAYNMIWSDYQLNLVDPASNQCLDSSGSPDPSISIDGVCGQPWQAIIANAGEAHINGINVEFDYAFNDNWLIGANYEVMEAETDTQHDLNGDGIDDLVAGYRLPLVPSSKGSVWLEYAMPTDLFGADEFFMRTQWSYSGDNMSVLEPRSQLDEPNPQFTNPAYTIGDLRMGIIGEDWQFDVFINNITDERAVYTTLDGMFEWGAAQTAEGRPHHQSLYTNRPREAGIPYMKRWGD
ncbi:MAG: TonB-dependent receptor, partial [Pseudomonadota bacterium]|nr:TonB-dependent receptor [Pseudomonadota bacterium]